MGKLKAKLDAFRFKGIIAITLVFALIAVILFIELSGVRYRYAQKSVELLPRENIVTKTQACAVLDETALLLYSDRDKASIQAYKEFNVILNDMKIGTEMVNLSNSAIPDLNNYSIVIPYVEDDKKIFLKTMFKNRKINNEVKNDRI